MSDPGLYFKNKTEFFDWYEKNLPDQLADYFKVIKNIKNNFKFPGSVRLLKKEAGDPINGFLTFLTELNLANLLIKKGATPLAYESKIWQKGGIDFSFNNILISVKSLNTKKYEEKEKQEVEKMKIAGGGKNNLIHRTNNLSEVFIEVEKNEMGTYTQTRTETGSLDCLDSDLFQMRSPLKYISKFDNFNSSGNFKNVLFILSYSEEFRVYHGEDIGYWYFDYSPEGYRPISDDPSLYLRLMKKDQKANNIDAIIFVWPPNSIIWPNGYFDKSKVLIFSKDNELKENLLSILS